MSKRATEATSATLNPGFIAPYKGKDPVEDKRLEAEAPVVSGLVAEPDDSNLAPVAGKPTTTSRATTKKEQA